MKKIEHDKDLKGKVEAGNQIRAWRALGVALAVLLALSCGIVPNPAQSQPTATATPVPTETAAPTLSPTSTPAPPSLLSSVAVACREGPGDAYGLVANLQAGEEAEIVGQAEGYWVVKTTSEAVCWVSDQGVVPNGDVAALPNVEAPPVPTPAAPAAPANLEVLIVSCYKDKSLKPSKFVNQFHLYWQDLSDNEDGFRAYRDGNLVAELPADKTEVIDQTVTKNIRIHNYYVTAYNEVGESKSEVVGIGCTEGGGGGGGYP